MAVREALRSRLSALEPLEEHRFTSPGEEGVNLILRLPGREAKLAPLLMGAHSDDQLHSTAADNNASGVAALVELANCPALHLRAARQPLKLMVSLEMLAFSSEKQTYPVPGIEAVYGHRGDFIALVANIGSSLMLLSHHGLAGAQRRPWNQGSETERPQPHLGCGL